MDVSQTDLLSLSTDMAPWTRPQNIPLLIVNAKPVKTVNLNLHPKLRINELKLPVVCIMICFLMSFRY